MTHSEHNEEPREKRGGLPVDIRWLLVAILVLFVLVLLPKSRQEAVAERVRGAVPAIGVHGNGKAEDGGELSENDTDYKRLYEAKVAQFNEVLEILKGRPRRKHHEIEAEVLGRHRFEGHYTGELTLSAGEEDGVRSGMVVTSRDRVAIGQIVGTQRRTSTMLLVTSPRLKMSVYIPARNLCGITHAEPSLVRTGELALLLPPPALFVSAIQEDEARATGRAEQRREPQHLEPGDHVFTMATSSSDPYADGVLLGTVSHLAPVEKSSAGWPLRARVIPGRMDSLRFVRIVAPEPFKSTVSRSSN